jgi:hypothetical protein
MVTAEITSITPDVLMITPKEITSVTSEVPTITPKAPPVIPKVLLKIERLLVILQNRELSRKQIMELLDVKNEKHFHVKYRQVAIAHGLIEMTLPKKPRSRMQRYRLTIAGRKWLETHSDGRF